MLNGAEGNSQPSWAERENEIVPYSGEGETGPVVPVNPPEETENQAYISEEEKNKRESEDIEYKYEKYLFAYYCRSYKGRLYLILSSNELNRKKVKKIVNFEECMGKTFGNLYVVIFIDENNKQIDVVRKYISENIKNICEIA